MAQMSKTEAVSMLQGLLACRGAWLARVVAVLAKRSEADRDSDAEDIADAMGQRYEAAIERVLEALAVVGLAMRFTREHSATCDYFLPATPRDWALLVGANGMLVKWLAAA